MAAWILRQQTVMLAAFTVRRIATLALILPAVVLIVNFLATAAAADDPHRARPARQVAGNLDAALRNPSFVRFQLACLLDRSPCDRIGMRIKGLLPEMVATGQCSQCSPQEIGQAGKVMSFIEDNYPVEYEQLEKKFLSDTKLQDVFD